MTPKEMTHEIREKIKVLNWLLKNKINTVNEVGKIISEYYANNELTMNAVDENMKPNHILNL
jgi:hypothetical protein